MKHPIKQYSKDISEVQWAFYKSTMDYLIPAWCIKEKWKLNAKDAPRFAHITWMKWIRKHTDICWRKRGCLPSIPSLDAWVSLNIYLGCLGHPQAWDLASPPSPHIETSLIFEHFIHTKLNKTFVRSVSIIMQSTTLSIVANPFIFYYCIIPTVF